jgi:hypothetical protein
MTLKQYMCLEHSSSITLGVGTRILIFFALDPKLVPKPEV